MKRITIIGNVGRVPTMRQSSKGKNFYELSVAVNSPHEDAFWVNLILRESSANVVPYLTKGKLIFADGNFTVDVYKNAPSLTLYVDNIQLLGGNDKPTEDNTPQEF